MKVDLKKAVLSYRAKAHTFSIIEVPELCYLMIDGHGAPGSAPFQAAVEALFPLAYSIKFLSKTDLDRDYVVPPLEGLWWAEDMSTFTTRRDKSQWDWTLMMLTPDWITADHVEEARARATAKKAPPPKLADLRHEPLREGTCVQTLHLGSFDDEGPVLDTMHHRFIPDNDLRLVGKHHEIYLSDFRRVAPEKLRTILRQPVAPDSP